MLYKRLLNISAVLFCLLLLSILVRLYITNDPTKSKDIYEIEFQPVDYYSPTRPFSSQTFTPFPVTPNVMVTTVPTSIPGTPGVIPTHHPTTIPGTGYIGIPLLGIQAVVRDQTVTILTNNFPPNQTFTVRMGSYCTKGIGGIIVATTDSGVGGQFQVTYNIPSSLFGSQRIAIRLDSKSGYYANNWFWNNSTDGTSEILPNSVPTACPPKSPSLFITSVSPNNDVVAVATDFPPNRTITVRMGEMGTKAVDGTIVGTIDSGSGGTLQKVFSIPRELKSSEKIAIRMESTDGYYAYTWFPNLETKNPNRINAVVPFTSYKLLYTTVTNIIKNNSINLQIYDLPPNKTLICKMGVDLANSNEWDIVVLLDSRPEGIAKRKITDYKIEIPKEFYDQDYVGIRCDPNNEAFYAFAWFKNSYVNYDSPSGENLSLTPMPSNNSTPIPPAILNSKLYLLINYPAQMMIGKADSMSISLINDKEVPSSLPNNDPKRKYYIAIPEIFLTNPDLVSEILNSDEICVTATWDGEAFVPPEDTEAAIVNCQKFRKPRIIWERNFLAKDTNLPIVDQVINVSVKEMYNNYSISSKSLKNLLWSGKFNITFIKSPFAAIKFTNIFILLTFIVTCLSTYIAWKKSL